MTSKADDYRPDLEIVTVRPTQSVMTLQRLPYFTGISATTSGATGLAMNLVAIPAGGAALSSRL
jgi:uncharacterized RmlC-like cupin family protein